LSEHCQLLFNPLPVGGCAIGRIEARGDLFEEMRAPVMPGDWKDAR
jgi:hypothetical protein